MKNMLSNLKFTSNETKEENSEINSPLATTYMYHQN